VKIKRDWVGWRCRRTNFPTGDFYDVLLFGRFTIVVKDQNGREIVLQRDDFQNDWIKLARSPDTQKDFFKPFKPETPF